MIIAAFARPSYTSVLRSIHTRAPLSSLPSLLMFDDISLQIHTGRSCWARRYGSPMPLCRRVVGFQHLLWCVHLEREGGGTDKPWRSVCVFGVRFPFAGDEPFDIAHPCLSNYNISTCCVPQFSEAFGGASATDKLVAPDAPNNRMGLPLCPRSFLRPLQNNVLTWQAKFAARCCVAAASCAMRARTTMSL